jgi:hypothetical protein
MRAQLECDPQEERDSMKSAGGPTLIVRSRKSSGQSTQENEQGLDRFLSRWLTMYTEVEDHLRSEALKIRYKI